MRIDQTAQAPVGIQIETKQLDGTFKSEVLLIPKFDFDDFVAWAAVIDAEREHKATESLEPVDKFKLLTLYPMMPIDVGDLNNWIETPKGISYIIEVCLIKAGKDKAFIENFRKFIPRPQQRILAHRLADSYDPTAVDVADEGITLGDEGAQSPLTKAPIG